MADKIFTLVFIALLVASAVAVGFDVRRTLNADKRRSAEEKR